MMSKQIVSRDAVVELMSRARRLGCKSLRAIPGADNAFEDSYLLAVERGKTDLHRAAFVQLHKLLDQM